MDKFAKKSNFGIPQKTFGESKNKNEKTGILRSTLREQSCCCVFHTLMSLSLGIPSFLQFVGVFFTPPYLVTNLMLINELFILMPPISMFEFFMHFTIRGSYVSPTLYYLLYM